MTTDPKQPVEELRRLAIQARAEGNFSGNVFLSRLHRELTPEVVLFVCDSLSAASQRAERAEAEAAVRAKLLLGYRGWFERSGQIAINQQSEIAEIDAALNGSAGSALLEERDRLREENERLRAKVLNAAGDDLCRFSQEEIKAMSLGEIKIPPKEEFLASCAQFHAQVAKDAGVLEGGKTIAQLEAENERLLECVDKMKGALKKAQSILANWDHWKECNCNELAQDGRYCERHTALRSVSAALSQQGVRDVWTEKRKS